jgi:NitT/TauT family transport system substrate-binding protein
VPQAERLFEQVRGVRMKNFYDKIVRAGVAKPSVALVKSYTLQFVNKKVGLDLRPK